jgi:uncharacterized protein YydD (DUF2326 family)
LFKKDDTEKIIVQISRLDEFKENISNYDELISELQSLELDEVTKRVDRTLKIIKQGLREFDYEKNMVEKYGEEFNDIQDEVFNLFPNHHFQRYNHQFSDTGIKYTTKHIGEDINRFGYLTNEFNGK